MASIHTRIRNDGSIAYRVAFRINGRQALESFETKDEAEKFRKLVDSGGGGMARKILLDDDTTPSAPTLTEWMREYLDPDSGLLGGVEKDTRAKYRRIAEQSFLKRLGDVPLTAITTNSVRAWVNWQAEQTVVRGKMRTYSAKTIANYHGLLSSALAAAVAERIIDSNPAYRVKLPDGTRKPIVFLTESEFATLYQAIPEFYQPMALALTGSGLRFSELSALTWGDVMEVDGGWCFDVNKAWKEGAGAARWVGQPKSEAGYRTVSVPDNVIEMLGKRKHRDALVFASKRDNPISSTTFAACGVNVMSRDICLR